MINYKNISYNTKEELVENLKTLANENGKGKYKFLDIYVCEELRPSYNIVYVQYKIEKIQ